jgi:hypothetical protein
VAPADLGDSGAQDQAKVEDGLRRLEQRLDQASATAERLLADAVAQVGGAPRKPPPAGWHPPSPEGGTDGAEPNALFGADADLLLGLLVALRERIPPELQQRLIDALHELLVAVRALIDWYLQRSERRRAEPAEVQDIPIL